MTELIKVVAVQPLADHWLRVSFSDGAVKDIDVGDLLDGGGVFTEIPARREIFERVRVNPESGTVEWPGDVDLDSEVLYGRFEPEVPVRIERRMVRAPSKAPA
jgi:Protein of unknown function (DUF2442)